MPLNEKIISKNHCYISIGIEAKENMKSFSKELDKNSENSFQIIVESIGRLAKWVFKHSLWLIYFKCCENSIIFSTRVKQTVKKLFEHNFSTQIIGWGIHTHTHPIHGNTCGSSRRTCLAIIDLFSLMFAECSQRLSDDIRWRREREGKRAERRPKRVLADRKQNV